MAEIEITGPDGAFGAYVATPASGTGPGVIVIQEVFGVNKFLRETSDWLAEEGFVAIAPDLFWRFEPGLQLDPAVQADFEKALDLFGKYDQEKGMGDLAATLAHARGMAETTGKIGCIGYCLGGRLAYMMAARTDIDASVGYYGVGLDQLLDEKDKIGRPLMLHIAEEDGFVPKDEQERVHAGLDSHPQATLFDYAGADHGFARPGGHGYSEAAATQANGQTLDFLRRTLA